MTDPLERDDWIIGEKEKANLHTTTIYPFFPDCFDDTSCPGSHIIPLSFSLTFSLCIFLLLFFFDPFSFLGLPL